MYFTLLVVVILTAIALVAVALGIARAVSPRSYNPQKGEAYECGIPTRGRSWMQFKVGYYLFAILFLMFDVETVFLFSWAVVVQDLGDLRAGEHPLLFGGTGSGPCLRMAERSFGMEIRRAGDQGDEVRGLQRQRIPRTDGGASCAASGTHVVGGMPRRGDRVGAQQQPLAADVRHELLRDRVHGRGGGALRLRPVRVRSGPRLPAPGRLHHGGRDDHAQDGPGAEAPLRPDGRSRST